MDKLRLSALGLCGLGCFFGLGLEAVFSLRLCYGRIATFNVDAMLKLLSVTGAAIPSAAGCVLLKFWFSNLGALKVFGGCDFWDGRWFC